MKKYKWADCQLQLVTGDPWVKDDDGNYNHPASFSRFILPFAYRLEDFDQQKTEDHGMVFVEKRPGERRDIHSEDYFRRRYFARATDKILYERSLWAKIENWHPVEFAVSVSKFRDPVKVRICTPQVVLFEYFSNTEKLPPNGRYDSREDLLHIGLLVVEAVFITEKGSAPPIFDDLLAFNDFFRYFDCPYEERAMDFLLAFGDMPIDFTNVKRGRLVSIKKDKDFCKEDIDRYRDNKGLAAKLRKDLLKNMDNIFRKRWKTILQIPLKIKENGKERLVSLITRGTDEDGIFIYDDTRAFVYSCAILQNGSFSLEKAFSRKGTAPENYGHWIKFINVDTPGETSQNTHQVTAFEREWGKPRTYDRWQHFGTLYGFNYHSGVMLAGNGLNPPVWVHFGRMYFDQVLLLFYIRIALFRFSSQLSQITEKMRDQLSDANYSQKNLDEFIAIRRLFSEFANLYQFPLISNQQQGIEMFGKAREFLELQTFFDEVKDQIQSTHEFFEIRTANDLSEKASIIGQKGFKIARIGLVGLGVSLLMGLMGMPLDDIGSLWDCLTGNGSCSIRPPFIFSICIVFISGILFNLIVKRCLTPSKKKRNQSGE